MRDAKDRTGTFFSDEKGRAVRVLAQREEQQPVLCVVLVHHEQTKLVRDCVCVCQRETSAFADVDWQEGAAGMWLAAALCGTGTNRSIIA